MDNYPPGTWAGDPRAPWNQPDPWEGMTCGDCKWCGELDELGHAGVPRYVCANPDFYEGSVPEVDPSADAEECFEAR